MHVKRIPHVCDHFEPFDPAFLAGLPPDYDHILDTDGGGIVYRLGEYRCVAIYKPQGSKVRYQVLITSYSTDHNAYSIHRDVLPKILPRILVAVRLDIFKGELVK